MSVDSTNTSNLAPPPVIPTVIQINTTSQLPLKLTYTNFPSWKVQLDTLLFGLDLDGYLNGHTIHAQSSLPYYSDHCCFQIIKGSNGEAGCAVTRRHSFQDHVFEEEAHPCSLREQVHRRIPSGHAQHR
ncbi:hypothetical protein COLO4_20063 [Corchorus olitorius]|uniref:Retrotransposon Copia-like N-terminal domain-containing protein n=1 Tax=Corchorus olitorius TaxID=93759 RepID=A0A1R3J1X1_9ROSI|nr:hypothetical protein COLO4_20063 [Corchorus olitorius]